MSESAHPILLAHGIARFDILRAQLRRFWKVPFLAKGDKYHYFKGIKSRLRRHGFDAYHSHVAFAASVADRASELGAEVRRILAKSGAERVHIVAHSMGGLDARRMIVDCPEMAGAVASLSTIGTPHNGTSFADVGLAMGGGKIIDALARVVSLEGYKDLSRAACASFNDRVEAIEARNGVVYQTWSSVEPEESNVFMTLTVPWRIINREEGANDGLVSEASQSWTGELRDGAAVKVVKRHRFPFAADHWNQVGWWHVNRWSRADGWRGLSAAIDEYENRVGEVYLDIARSVADLA
jgi:triacylglycerol esterase/lipase EstA (alpha/beta hydrolase family)